MAEASYIVFEGGEGSGKSTQARRLADRLSACLTLEPGGTALGRELRSLLLDVDRPAVAPRAEALLMAADRAQHLAEVVEPALASGRHVVSDRSLYSSLAYQGGARQLGVDAVRAVNWFAVAGRLPDIVVLLDCPPAIAATRMGSKLDRLEREGADFHQVVHDTYHELARDDPDHWIVVDAIGDPDSVEAEVWRHLFDRVRDEL